MFPANVCEAEVWWLSLLHHFIDQSLITDFSQVQILLTACWRLAMVRMIPAGKKAKRLSLVNHTTKAIHHHHHHHHHHPHHIEISQVIYFESIESIEEHWSLMG